MKLFLISNEFFRSSLKDSFRATVIAPDANAARWLVGQRSARMQFSEVAGASAFLVADVENAVEGVLTVEHRSGSKLFQESEFKRYPEKTDTFYEVALWDGFTHEELLHVPGKATWFATGHNSDILMRRVVLEQSPDGYIGQGYFSNEVVVHQFFRVGRSTDSTWMFKPNGEVYTTQYYDMGQASLLEIRAAILRSAKLLRKDTVSAELLAHLWSFVSEEKIGTMLPVDAKFFEGQTLYWSSTEVREWALAIPQVVAGTPTIDEENTKPIPGTLCLTLKDAKDI